MKRTALLPAAAAIALLATPNTPALAQDAEPMVEDVAEQSALEMRAAQVVDVINGDAEPEDVFTQGFLDVVTPEQLASTFQQLTGQFGPALAVESVDQQGAIRSALAIRMESAIARGGIAIDPADENRVSELLLQSFDPVGDTATKIADDLAALPGETNAFLARLDQVDAPVFASNADTQLALGSAFKLYVLSALNRSIEAGERDWADVIPLDQKSLPSGRMQDWPEGAPVTLHTLAAMMISISDNTATDQLIALLGAQAVEAELERSGNSDISRTVPLMTTRQLFSMRGVDDEVLARYRAADDKEQRAILAGLTENDVSMDKVQQTFATDTPGAIDIEWFASSRDLAGLLSLIAQSDDDTAREIMAINPGLPGSAIEGWDYVGFKGGSEPGVLNLTWLLRDDAGEYWIMTAGWNNPEAAVDAAALQAIVQRILALPR